MGSLKTFATAIAAAGLLAASLGAQGTPPPASSPDAALVHVLNRVTFGARSADLVRVRRIGIDRYIDEQLHPERIADGALDARLTSFETLGLSSREIAERYEQPARQARRDRQRAQGDSGREVPRPQTMPPNLPLSELGGQKVLRAVYSERQLQEVLTDFWFNHFNVDARKGPSRYMLTEYEREVIRPRVLGSFRDLLGATGKSPAMLFYLDNWMSAAPADARTSRAAPSRGQTRGRRGLRSGATTGTRMRPAPGAAPNARMPRGLNENYGRELLELHTLGVDGGYTQKDVTEVARALTGWTIDQPRQGGGFRFVAALHDDGEKVVLGQKIAAGGGQRDGERVLDILAAHPSTARLIATKLARRFVSDEPPPSLVDRAAKTFLDSRGDLRKVTAVILTSPEFLSPEAQRAKIKTPFEFLVSALRTTNAEILDARPLVRALQDLGMPLYQCQPPTGYKDTAEAWVNTGALVNRMNTALALADGSLRGVRVAGGLGAETLVAGDLSDTTRDTIGRAASPAQAMALALGSPEFQRR